VISGTDQAVRDDRAGDERYAAHYALFPRYGSMARRRRFRSAAGHRASYWREGRRFPSSAGFPNRLAAPSSPTRRLSTFAITPHDRPSLPSRRRSRFWWPSSHRERWGGRRLGRRCRWLQFALSGARNGGRPAIAKSRSRNIQTRRRPEHRPSLVGHSPRGSPFPGPAIRQTR
jgi:hypothetical protein